MVELGVVEDDPVAEVWVEIEEKAVVNHVHGGTVVYHVNYLLTDVLCPVMMSFLFLLPEPILTSRQKFFCNNPYKNRIKEKYSFKDPDDIISKHWITTLSCKMLKTTVRYSLGNYAHIRHKNTYRL